MFQYDLELDLPTGLIDIQLYGGQKADSDLLLHSVECTQNKERWKGKHSIHI